MGYQTQDQVCNSAEKSTPKYRGKGVQATNFGPRKLALLEAGLTKFRALGYLLAGHSILGIMQMLEVL